MKKLLAIVLALVMIFAVAACAVETTTPPAATPAPTPEPAAAPEPAPEAPATDEPAADAGPGFGVISWNEGEIPLALITDYGDIDDESFNQGSWEGLVQFAQPNGIPYEYFRPVERGSTEANLDSISQAVAAGAQVIVTPGFLFTEAIYEAQQTWPDLTIILLDAVPAPPGGDSVIGPNTAAVLYAEEQSGFLAGYAAVIDGYRDLGFVGGIAVPAVVRFGHGFVEGAEYAANELGLAAGDVTVRYNYLGSFAPSPEAQAMAASWFADGVEVIFAAAGGAGGSVFAAAEANNAKAIGVDVDQGHHSETVITSALKDLRSSVSQMLDAAFNGSFRGGEIHHFNAANQGVGLPDDFSRFNEFTKAQYDTIFGQLASGAITVSDDISDPNPNEILTLSLVTVTWVA